MSMMMISGSKDHADSSCLHVRGYMHLYDPPKHEKVAIFRRKMSGFRMFLGFRELEGRRNPVSSYDFRNNKTAVIAPDGKRIGYTYDNQNNLTGVSYPDGTSESFTYAANGNTVSAVSRMGIMLLWNMSNAEGI